MRKVSFAPGEYYHCYNRGTEKRKIYINDKDRFRFVALLFVCNSITPIHISNFKNAYLPILLNTKRGEPLVAIGAWSLMPNHFHILLKEIREDGISLFMQKLQTAYTMYFNKKYERSGALFQGTFKAEHLNKEIYLKYIFSYIHLNPIKLFDSTWKEEGLKDKKGAEIFLKNYQWSSYIDFRQISRAENIILNQEVFPDYFQKVKDFDSEIDDWLDSKGKV